MRSIRPPVTPLVSAMADLVAFDQVIFHIFAAGHRFELTQPNRPA